MNSHGSSPSHSVPGVVYTGGSPQQMSANYSSGVSRSPATSSVTSPQYVGNPPPYKHGYVYGSVPTGSNYSSPRSSIASYDSKGSISPRTSYVHPGPPPPYDFQRHGSPHSSGPSPRSSISIDSKQSSPRTSLASNSHGQIYDKLVNQRYMNQQGAINEINSIAGNVSLYNKYNESGAPPPPPYPDARMKAMPNSSPTHGSLYGTPQQTNVNMNAGNYAKHNNISPVHSANSIGRSGTSDSPGIHSQSASEPALLGSNTSSGVKGSPKTTMPNAYNNIGLRYDVVPPKHSGPSDVERKLAALTEQLENEMRITSSPSSSSPKKSPDKKPPPPPYHGPHMTEPLPLSPPHQVMPSYATSPISPASSASSPSSLKVTSPLRTPLPMQVTPPQRKGPSEAEKKLEALTQELETQMERHPQGEYFGKIKSCHSIIRFSEN